MSYGLLQQGQSTKNQAISGMASAAKMEQQRNLTNDSIDRQDKQAKVTNITAGATTGAMLGASSAATAGAQTGAIGGPWGMAIGAAAGFLFSELF